MSPIRTSKMIFSALAICMLVAACATPATQAPTSPPPTTVSVTDTAVPTNQIIVPATSLSTSAATAQATTAATTAPTAGAQSTKAPTVRPPITSVPPATDTPQPGKTPIIWWSHWANEPLRRQVIEQVVKDYEAAHPNVDIILSWWDINALTPALRAAMTANAGQPDISTDADIANMAKAGWVLDLTDKIPWGNFVPGIKEASGVAGLPGLYKFNVAIQQLMIFYNKDIFAKLGIDVPANFTFTKDQFVQVVQKCHDGGYAGVADSIGNRNYPALYPIWAAQTNMEGTLVETQYDGGQKSWDNDNARQVLNWMAQLTSAGMWPKTFSTMGIDEFHVFFHTQQQACMIYIPSFYTGRAFKPVAQGGQSPDFHFGMLRYPTMDNATHTNELWANGDSGYMVMATTKHPDIATDILTFMAQPKYAALWTATTFTPSALKYDPVKDWPTDVPGADKWQWYYAEINKVYGGMNFVIGTDSPCGDFLDARTTALNQGIPLGLVTVPNAITMLDAHLCPKP